MAKYSFTSSRRLGLNKPSFDEASHFRRLWDRLRSALDSLAALVPAGLGQWPSQWPLSPGLVSPVGGGLASRAERPAPRSTLFLAQTNQPAGSSGKRARTFHATRPAATGVKSSLSQTPTTNQGFKPLPPPTGQSPYHLSLDDVLPADWINAVKQSGRILFHVAGDTGGVKQPQPQQIVAMAMETHFNFPDLTLRPSFFYHLGDVVYYYGEAKEYYGQFYEPYVHYPAPIFAIPGNHDGDMTTDSAPSLTAFVNNFCAPQPVVTPDAGETSRDAMTQPNAYWTLDAPFLTVIGLYSNVPEGGKLDNDQIAWLVNELRTAPTDKALIVAVHHPPYSADSFHSGSNYMNKLLDNAFSQSGRIADMVFSGHVHNYQRFTRTFQGRHIPYLVVGSGGYWNLHYLAKNADGSQVVPPVKMPDNPELVLESAVDDRHGFMRLMAAPGLITGEYWSVPRPQESWRAPAQRVDGFVLDVRQHLLIRGAGLG